MAVKFLDNTGLGYFWSKIKAWCNATFAAITHNQASNTINAMTSYSKPNSGSAITTSDSLNTAIGKLEAKVDAVDNSNVVHKTDNEVIRGVKTFISGIKLTDNTTAEDAHSVYYTYSYNNEYVAAVMRSTVTVDDIANNAQIAIKSYFNGSRITDFTTILRLFNKNPVIAFYDSQLTKGTNPSSTVQNGLLFCDSVGANNNHLVGRLDNIVYSSGETCTCMRAYDWTADSTNSSYIGIHYPKEGTPYTYAPHPVLTDNSNKIATTYFVKNQGYLTSHQSLSDYVTLSTEQTISGKKIFLMPIVNKQSYNGNTGYYRATHTLLDSTQTPSTDTYYTLVELQDKNSLTVGTLQSVKYANGNVGNYLTARKHVVENNQTVQKIGYLGIYVSNTGDPYTYAPTPPSTDNGTTIATTAFVKAQGYLTSHQSLSNYVTLNSEQTISGHKVFSSSPSVVGSAPQYVLKNTSFTRNSSVSSSVGTVSLILTDNANNRFSGIYSVYDTNKTGYLSFILYSGGSTSSSDYKVITMAHSVKDNAYYFIPGTDNLFQLGSGTSRWKQLYAATSSINTSDERLKSAISTVPDEILDAWDNINFVQFKFNDAIEEKGDNARIHTGLIAQSIDKVFQKAGINTNKYSFFCYDEWEAQPEEYDKENDIKKPALEAGNKYSLRYEEALCIEAAYQRRKNKILENQIQELEKRIAKLEEYLK